MVVSADGRVMSAVGTLSRGLGSGSVSARLNARQALDSAALRQGARAHRPLKEAEVRTTGRRTFPNVYGEGTSSSRPVSTELVWNAVDHGRTLRLAWLTDIESSGDDWWESVVDAQDGAVVDRTSRYAHAGPEGTVTREQHPEAPGATRQVTPFSGLDGSWVSGTTTSGNNANAYLDRDEDNTNNEYQPTAADQHFNYAFTDAWRTTADATAHGDGHRPRPDHHPALLLHQRHARLALRPGFDEASGNFQRDNFGRGGSGGDPVLAEADDGCDSGCVNDCGRQPGRRRHPLPEQRQLRHTADGSSPRMQMFMWAPDAPFRDGDVDGDVIAHEYGHGVSSRLVGGGTLGYSSGDQRGGMGEGWSDVISTSRSGTTRSSAST